MYRNGNIYDEICKVIIDIYIDYDIKTFPIDELEICRRLKIALVPYSSYEEKDRALHIKKSPLGYFVKASLTTPPTIYYNDIGKTQAEIRFTIFHELKHYVFEDSDDSDDDLADFFSRYFMCPIPYMLLKKIDTPAELMSYCLLSETAAKNACSTLINRRAKYGYKIFDHEFRLIEQLEPVLIDAYKLKRPTD